MARIIFQGANLLDGDKPARAGATVVVEGETIRSVGSASVATQPGDRLIELDGKTLMPGLISSHFHASYNNITIQPEPLGVQKPENWLALPGAKNQRTAPNRRINGVVPS